MRPIGLHRALMLALPILLCSVATSLAQDVDYDYRYYKFYEEQEEELPLVVVADSIPLVEERIVRYPTLSFGSSYALSRLGFRPRGADYNDEEWRVNEILLSRNSAYTLQSLGVDREVATPLLPHGNATTTRLLLGNERGHSYEGHYISSEFSGRRYIGGITHRAVWKPLTNGIRLDNGWTISHITRIKAGNDLYIKGVDNNSIDIAIEATRSNRRGSLDLIALLPYSHRGLRQSSTEEAFSLTSNRLYNPAWGLDHGKVRNSRIATSLRPEALAVWDYRLSAISTLHLVADLSFEATGTTSLAWFNAITPRPDYYRYMPSYFSNEETKRYVTNSWAHNDLRYTQIDWNELYRTNSLQPDGHARYAVERRRSNITTAQLSAVVENHIGNLNLSAGLNFYLNSSHNFKVMADLLGSDHIVDHDYYLIDDEIYSNHLQNNLLHPNRTIHKGDRYGYNYRINEFSLVAFCQAKWEYDEGGIEGRLSVGSKGIQRRGYYEKELFPGAGSLGRSTPYWSSPYLFALAWQHNIGNHNISLSGTLEGRTPQSSATFLQEEYNNRLVNNLTLGTNLTFDFSYNYTLSNHLIIKCSLFASALLNGFNVIHFYSDIAQTFSDGVVRNIDIIRCGVETSADVTWSRLLSSSFYASYCANRYANNAIVETYADTDNRLISTSESLMRGRNTGTPELALYGDLKFRMSGWSATIALGYTANRFVTPSFVRRTVNALTHTSSVESREGLLAQQRLGDIFYGELSVSKYWRLEHCSLKIGLNIHNLFGQQAIYNGYEQNRILRHEVMGRGYLSPMDNRITYNYPRTFRLNLSIWF